jgi:hypothetical protein
VLFSLLFWDKYFGSGPVTSIKAGGNAVGAGGKAGGGGGIWGRLMKGKGADKNPNLCGGAVQVESSRPIAESRLVSTLCLRLSSDILVSKFALSKFNLYRYSAGLS